MIFAIVYGAIYGLILYFAGKDDESEKTRSAEKAMTYWHGEYERVLLARAREREAAATGEAHE